MHHAGGGGPPTTHDCTCCAQTTAVEVNVHMVMCLTVLGGTARHGTSVQTDVFTCLADVRLAQPRPGVA